MESPDKKSWKIPNSSCRIGFNDAGVFYQQEQRTYTCQSLRLMAENGKDM